MFLLAVFSFLSYLAPLISAAAVISNTSPNHENSDLQSGDAASLTGPPCCFSDSCLSWSLDPSGRVLSGVCYNKTDQRGHWSKVSSGLDLGHCVGNFDGVLKGASAGAYSRSCDRCTLDGTKLTCRCTTAAGKQGVYATVDLNAFVQDFNGRLRCFDYDGE